MTQWGFNNKTLDRRRNIPLPARVLLIMEASEIHRQQLLLASLDKVSSFKCLRSEVKCDKGHILPVLFIHVSMA